MQASSGLCVSENGPKHNERESAPIAPHASGSHADGNTAAVRTESAAYASARASVVPAPPAV